MLASPHCLVYPALLRHRDATVLVFCAPHQFIVRALWLRAQARCCRPGCRCCRPPYSRLAWPLALSPLPTHTCTHIVSPAAPHGEDAGGAR